MLTFPGTFPSAAALTLYSLVKQGEVGDQRAEAFLAATELQLWAGGKWLQPVGARAVAGQAHEQADTDQGEEEEEEHKGRRGKKGKPKAVKAGDEEEILEALHSYAQLRVKKGGGADPPAHSPLGLAVSPEVLLKFLFGLLKDMV